MDIALSSCLSSNLTINDQSMFQIQKSSESNC